MVAPEAYMEKKEAAKECSRLRRGRAAGLRGSGDSIATHTEKDMGDSAMECLRYCWAGLHG